MSYSSRQGQYLSVMGIQRWVLREQPEEQGRVDKRSASTSESAPDMVEPHKLPPQQGRVDKHSASTSESVLENAEPRNLPLQQGRVDKRSASTSESVPDIATLDWDALQQRVATCQHCTELATTRTQTVFGVGNRQADWMLIGEAPGMEEDRQGEPFVGPAGQLLNAMLAALGLSRQQVYIANVLKCRPPNNRDPHVDEAAACLPYLHRQIALVQPKMILLVGRIAAQQVLGTDANVGKLRGLVHRYQDDIPMIVTYHPAYLLRKPSEKRKSWQDLCLARAQLEAP